MQRPRETRLTQYLRLVRCERNVDLLEGLDPLGGEGVADLLEALLGTH